MTYKSFRIYIWNLAIFVLCFLIKVTNTSAACHTPYSISLDSVSTDFAAIRFLDFNLPGDVEFHEYIIVPLDTDPDFSAPDTTYDNSINVIDLISGQSYEIYIKTNCIDEQSDYSNGFVFSTYIDNDSPCSSNLLLKDNNCNNPDTIYLQTLNLSDSLGSNIFIKSIQLSVEHPWPADLEVSILSPSGVLVPLLSDKGTGFTNVGDINNPCSNSLILDMNACENITSNTPLIGTYRPEGNLELLYENSDPNGIWKLVICDDAQGQIGTVKYAKIDFIGESCSGPEALFVDQIGSTQANIIIPPSNCDSLKIQYQEMQSGEWTTIYINCSGDTILLDNLIQSTEYMFNYSPMCSGTTFSTSCPYMITTRCSEPTLYESFDNAEICNNSCQSTCTLDNSIWMNNGEMNWNIIEGSTPTIFTGPESGYNNHGKYIYLESSNTDCTSTKAELISTCLLVENSSDCNLSFAYHMFGNDIGRLVLEINANSGSWDTLWTKSGNQGENWLTESFDFSFYQDQAIQLRFSARVPAGNFGDIALDDIVFSGINPVSDTLQFIYLDEDQDGYGNNSDSIMYCGIEPPMGYSFLKGDCDDENEFVNPSVPESPCNSIDDNCNGLFDETSNNLSYNIEEITDQTCFGVNDGRIAISVDGGTPPYQFYWSDGNQDSLRTDVQAGIYTGYVEDDSGCQISIDTIEISIIQKFDYLISSIDSASCLGVFDGSVTIFHDETNAPFNYLWSNGDTMQNLTNVTAGNYELSISDVNGCLIETDPIYIAPQRTIAITTDSIRDVRCFEDNNGFIDLSISENKGVPTFLWNTEDTTSFLEELAAGIYTVTVTDTTNCYTQQSFTIHEPAPLLTGLIANDPAVCYGEENGKIEIEVNGGVPPYQAEWNNEYTGFKNTELKADIYSVTVTDHNNCIDSLGNIEVSQPDSLFINEMTIEPAICLNSAGSINLGVQGGSGDYVYYWSDNVDHMSSADSLSSGIYSVTILDAFDCKVSEENIGVSLIDIPLTLNETMHEDIACFGDTNGSFAIELTNLTSLPVTYNFNNTTIADTSSILDFDNLPAGHYDIQASDNNGCQSDTLSISILQPDSLELNVDTVIHISCFGSNDGKINLSYSGGTPEYLIELNDEIASSEITNLKAGTYGIQLIDGNGCSTELDSILLEEPEMLSSPNIEISFPSCFGSQDGVLTFQPIGGVEPYEFTFNGQQQNNLTVENLGAGVYPFSLTDANECFLFQDTITLIEPDEIELSVESIKPSFCENANGIINLDASVGNENLNYTWYFDNSVEKDTFFTNNEAFAQNLLPGNYLVFGTDFNGCSDTIYNIDIINLDKNPVLSIDSLVDVRCFGNSNGKIFTSVSGQELSYPFEFFIDGESKGLVNEDSVSFENISAGIYTISFLDADGCYTELENVTLDSPPPIDYDIFEVSPVLCYGDTNAILSIDAYSASGIKDLLWSDGNSGDTISNLAPGKYACAIVDSNNCIQFTDTISIIEPDSLYITANVIDATNDLNNGAIYISTFGGSEPYMYIWNPELPTFVDTLESLSESVWELQVIDANGCSIDTLLIVDRIVNTSIYSENNINVYPNPARNHTNIVSALSIKKVSIISSQGQSISNQNFENQKKISINTTNLHSGIYFLKIELESDKVTYKKLIIE